MVSGNLTNQIVSSDEDYRLQATNLTAGKQLAEVESSGHSFRLPLVDLNRQDLVVEGDLVEIKRLVVTVRDEPRVSSEWVNKNWPAFTVC